MTGQQWIGLHPAIAIIVGLSLFPSLTDHQRKLSGGEQVSLPEAYLIIWQPDHITMAIALALLPKREKDILFLSIRNITQQST